MRRAFGDPFSYRKPAVGLVTLCTLAILLLLVQCTGTVSPPASATPTLAATKTMAAPTPQPTESSIVLTLWLPPQFDPSAKTPAAQALSDRLKAFTDANPNVKIDVRIKAISGTSGLLETLTAASQAAPSSMPSLIALTRSQLEEAAAQDLILPLDGLTTAMSDKDWYSYAQQLAALDDHLYGLPLAGDSLVFMQRSILNASMQDTWSALLDANQPILFAATDPQAAVTLAFYQSLGEPWTENNSHPALQADTLTKVLELYASGSANGTFPSWISNYKTDAQAWRSFQQGRGDRVITWFSTGSTDALAGNLSMHLIPSLGQGSATLADGWVLCLAEPKLERRAASIRLAEFLTSSESLAAWGPVSGYLPTRPSTLSAWPANSQALIKVIALSAIVPPSGLTDTTRRALEQAASQVIMGQSSPQQAVEAVSNLLSNP
ncbi:MAG TPA: extracellular solute-binding protein [Longilinea sp.]|nr:extracellular solute-binding protein [Longilinea sp.]